MSVVSTVQFILGGDGAGASAAFDAVREKTGGLNAGLKTLAVGGIATAAAGLAVLAGGLAVVGGIAFGASQDFDRAMGLVEARTGATGDELAAFGDVALDVFNNNWGESLGDVAAAMATVETITGAEGAALETVTSQALILRDVFEQDLTASVRAADTATENFGVNGAAVLDNVTRTLQTIGDPADDLLDTINEYSTDFADAGFSADDFFNILIAGTEAGAFNTDKVADSVREFTTRLIDGSSLTADALTGLGFNAETFSAKLADGSLSGAAALDLVIGHLENVDDQVEQDAIGVALFGSMWEDLGADAILALGNVDNALGDTEGATFAAGEAVSRGLGPQWEAFKRNVTTALIPLGDFFAELLAEWAPSLTTIADWLAVRIPVAVEALRAFWVDEAMPAIVTAAGWLEANVLPHLVTFGAWLVDTGAPAVQAIAADIMTVLVPGLEQLGIWAGALAEAALPVLGAAVVWVKDNFDIIGPIIAGVGVIILALTAPLIVAAAAVIAFAAAYNENWLGVRDATDEGVTRIGALIDNFKLTWAALMTWLDVNVVEVWAGNMVLLEQTWEAAKNNIGAAWDSFRATLEVAWAVIKPIFDAVEAFAAWLSGTVFDFNINLPELPDWAIPGSPLPLHSAWSDFGDYLQGQRYAPAFDLGQVVGPPGGPSSGAPRLAPVASGAGRGGVVIEQIVINDEAAAAMLLSYLEAAADAADL